MGIGGHSGTLAQASVYRISALRVASMIPSSPARSSTVRRASPNERRDESVQHYEGVRRTGLGAAGYQPLHRGPSPQPVQSGLHTGSPRRRDRFSGRRSRSVAQDGSAVGHTSRHASLVQTRQIRSTTKLIQLNEVADRWRSLSSSGAARSG
jgi:hypothetical protein